VTSLELVALTLDAHDPARLAAFWSGLLDRPCTPDGSLPGSATQVGLRCVPSSTPKTGPGRVHLHVGTSPETSQEAIVERALALGASPLDVGQLPEEQHVVLADPEGNEFCVIEPGNSWLAGCGRLGELACDGTREVGLFWAAALGWPLVWDQDGETAIQSPTGGTKVAWGGPPLAAKPGRNRQAFELRAGGDPAGAVARLVELGATRRGDTDAGVELADPDGNEFRVLL
jgi:catechol 2,3-dioxygenase-like lactoylglutathione lyase family enzyme